MPLISSPDNQLVKDLVRLHDRRDRREAGLVLLEGPHLLAEALAAGCPLTQLLVLDKWAASARGQELLRAAARSGAAPIEATERVMAKVSTTASPAPVAAAVRLADLLRPGTEPAGSGLVLDDLQDPGNLGTILRTAWGAGISTILATAGTVDLFAPKVLRSAQGAHFHLRLREMGRDELLATIRREGWWLAAAEAGGTVPFWRAELRQPCLIAIGNEARGLGDDLRAAAAEHVAVPLAPGVDSLNAAVGTGVILFELVRRAGG